MQNKCPKCGKPILDNGKCSRFPICSFCLTEKRIPDELIFFDLETTGLNKEEDRIIEIAAIRVVQGEIVDSFNTFVNPGFKNGLRVYLSKKISELTHITDEMLEGMRSEKQALDEFKCWCNDCHDFAGQNISHFDIPFMTYAMKRNQLSYEMNASVDTLIEAKKLRLKENGKVPDYKQTTLAAFFGITYQAHRAITDVEACIKLWESLTKYKYEQNNNKKII